MAKISAIVTTWNVEAYIAIALQSIIDCRFPQIEILVVDDGSNDLTVATIDMMKQSVGAGVDLRTFILSQNTVGGVATAANFGLDRARGDIVIFVDGDDWVIPDALKRAVALLERHDYDFVLTDCSEYWNGSGEYSKYPEARYWDRLEANSDLEVWRGNLLDMAPFPWRKIYRRSFLEEHGIRFPVGDFMFEDNPFHWETTLRARNFGKLREVTHVHRMARAGQTVANQDVRSLKIFDHFDTIRALVDRLEIGTARDHQLAKWLVKHILWVAERVPPAALNAVFERAMPRLAQFAPEVFWGAVADLGTSPRDMRRAAAVYLNARFEFFREF